MQQLALVKKITGYSKLAKFNLLMLVSVMIASTMLVSFAAETNTATTAASCGAKVSLVLDRSSSIGVPGYQDPGQSPAQNIEKVRSGAKSLVTALQGNDSYVDTFVFASVAKRSDDSNPQPRKQLTAGNVASINQWLSNVTFKTNFEDVYPDGMNGSGEGGTNWEWAFKRVSDASVFFGLPTHVVIFTDGEPTTTIAKTQAAINKGGSYQAAGYDGDINVVDQIDVTSGLNAAKALRDKGVKIHVVAVGSKSQRPEYQSNLNALAGSTGKVYMASDFNQLETKFKEAAANICEPTPDSNLLAIQGFEELPNGTKRPISIPVKASARANNEAETALRTVNGSTSTDPNLSVDAKDFIPFSTSTNFKINGSWRFSVEPTIPSTHEAKSLSCFRGNAGNAALAGDPSNSTYIRVTNVPANSWVYCDIIVTPKTTTVEGNELYFAARVRKSETISTNPGEFVTAQVKLTTSGAITPVNGVTKTADKDSTAVEGWKGAARFDTLTQTGAYTITAEVDPASIPTGYELTTDHRLCQRNGWKDASTDPSDVIAGWAAGNNNKEITATKTVPNKVTLEIPASEKYTRILCQFVVKPKTTPPTSNPGIELTKTVNPTTAERGDTVTYSFVVKNTGNVKLTNVRITDPMLNPTAPNVIHTIAEILPGASSTVYLRGYKIPDNAPNSIRNVAIAKGIPVDSSNNPLPEIQDEDDAVVTVTNPNRSWTTTKSANKTVVIPGETVTYTISVRNTGEVTLTNVQVSDPTIGLAVQTIPEIKPGETKSVTATYKIPENFTAKTFKNVALVCVPLQGQTPECKNPEKEIKIAYIEVVKTADKEQAGLGEAVVYTFVVTNKSDVTLYDIEVTDNVLGDLGTIEKLEPGQSVTKSVNFTTPTTVPAAGTIRNVVEACGAITDGGEPEVCDNDDHELIIVAGTTTSRPPTTTTTPEVQVKGATLAFTGSSSTWLATVAALIVAAGVGLIVVARKRKPKHNFF